ncbi:MAG: outer membrane beta-barrel protein [Alphaproteobacteria bacterium]|nr:outer membrane beta-barrel protein [Alphaproteobacteria bacterium]
MKNINQLYLTLFILFSIAHSINSSAQNNCIVSGKILNIQNEPVNAAVITVLYNNLTKKVIADLDGNFKIYNLPRTTWTLQVNALGYNLSEIKIIPDSFEIEYYKEIVLETNVQKLANIEVKSSRSKGTKSNTEKSILVYMKNAPMITSVISQETIAKLPDRNSAEIIKRLPGISIQENKFIIVRGLADRYNQVMLNNVLLSSTEADRKTFNMDIFPAVMIDNIIVNKTFTPSLPGEWAGGLVQIQTKSFPEKNFWNISIQSGLNFQTLGTTFYSDKPGPWDWLGIDGGYRALPKSFPEKSQFDALNPQQQTVLGQQLKNNWQAEVMNPIPNIGLGIVRGFTSSLFKNPLTGFLSFQYNRRTDIEYNINQQNTIDGNLLSVNYNYNDNKYIQQVQLNALVGLNYKLNNHNTLSYQGLINIKSANATTDRQGTEFVRGDSLKGSEFNFYSNVFTLNILNGEHLLAKNLRLDWFISYTTISNNVPDQRRIVYTKYLDNTTENNYNLLISNSLSQLSGSRIFKILQDNISSAGINIRKSFANLQLKAGWYGQIKGREYNAYLYANYLPINNPNLIILPPNTIFDPNNFGDGDNNKFAFGSIKGSSFSYVANTILHAIYLEGDYIYKNWRFIGGFRIENYDQLVANAFIPNSTIYAQSVLLDVLPSISAHYSLNSNSKIRFSATQTVIRPELRELSFLNIYDFDLNASVQGNPQLLRTKITNLDLRYEWFGSGVNYFNAGFFYKDFLNPIEQIFSEGSGGASTFSFQNANEAKVYGLEIEGKRSLDFVNALKNFSIQGSMSLINSMVKDPELNIERALQGQSNFIFNAGLLYNALKSGWEASFLYHQYGDRLYLIGDIQAGSSSPNVYEKSRPIFDVQVAKKFLKNKINVVLQIQDILNLQQIFYQNVDDNITYNANIDAIRFARFYGTRAQVTFKLNL